MAFDLAQSISQSMGGIGDAVVQRRQQQLLQSDLKRIFDTLQPEKKRSVERRMEGIMGRGDDLERQLMEEGASPMAAVGSRGQRSRARTEQPASSTQGNLQSDLSRTLQNMQTPEGLQMGMDLMQQHRKMQQEQQLSQQEQRQEMQMDELEHRRRMEREAFGEQAQLERQSALAREKEALRRQRPSEQQDAQKGRLDILRKNQQVLSSQIGSILQDYDAGDGSEIDRAFASILSGQSPEGEVESTNQKLDTAISRMRSIAEDDNQPRATRQKAQKDLQRMGQYRKALDQIISRGMNLQGVSPRGSESYYDTTQPAQQRVQEPAVKPGEGTQKDESYTRYTFDGKKLVPKN